MLLIATVHPFDRALIALGALLVLGALLAGLARRSFLSLTAVFVVAGFILGRGALDVLKIDPRAGFVGALATVALIVILFRDGLEVEAEMLRSAWHLPLRKLVLAMPLTCGLVAVFAHLLTSLDWTQCLLLGALLSPTDPVLSSSVITNPLVPRRVRHSLNLESGLNDGLALPLVLGFLAALQPGGGDFVWWRFVLENVLAALAIGFIFGYVAARLLPREVALGSEITARQRALYALGVAFAAYGLAVLVPHGNGLIATFVAAITVGIARPDVRQAFEAHMQEVVEVVKLGIFVVFGSLLTFGGLFHDGVAGVAVAVLTLAVARPVSVFAALAGTRTDFATRAFMGWFGPKGVATIAFTLLVLESGVRGSVEIADLAALTVLISIIAHGVTDHAGANWIARRAESEDSPRGELAAAAGGKRPAAQ